MSELKRQQKLMRKRQKRAAKKKREREINIPKKVDNGFGNFGYKGHGDPHHSSLYEYSANDRGGDAE